MQGSEAKTRQELHMGNTVLTYRNSQMTYIMSNAGTAWAGSVGLKASR